MIKDNTTDPAVRKTPAILPCKALPLLFCTLFLLLSFLFTFSATHAYENPDKSGLIKIDKIIVDGLISCSKGELLDLMNIGHGLQSRDAVTDGIKRAFRKGLFEDISVTYHQDNILQITVIEHDFIEDIIISGNSTLKDKEITKAFLLHEGDLMRYDLLYSAGEELRRSLALMGFPDASVSLKVVETSLPYRVAIQVNIDEAVPQTIEKIELIGFDSSLKKKLKTKEGDTYNLKRLKKDMRRLKNALLSMKYPGSRVGPFTFGGGVLTIFVDPGKRVDVGFSGNSRIKSSRLKKLLHFEDEAVIDRDSIEEAAERLVLAYHRQGYLDASVIPVKNEGQTGISLTFYLDEGPRYTVRKVEIRSTALQISTFFSSWRAPDQSILEALKRRMILKEGKPFSTELLAMDRETIITIYRSLGFLNAAITEVSVVEGDGDEKKKRVFKAEDIKAYARKRLDFLRQQSSQPREERVFDEHDEERGFLEKNIDNTEKLAARYGFSLEKKTDESAAAELPQKDTSVLIAITVSEGKNYRLNNVEARGNFAITDEAVMDMLNIRTANPYNELDIVNAKRRLLTGYREQGFIDVKVNIITDVSGQDINVIFNIHEGDRELFGKTIVRGNRITKTEVVLREVEFREGYPFNNKLVLDASRRLYQLGLFEDVKIRTLGRHGRKRDILISVKERKAGTVEFGAGYEDYEKYRGSVEFNYKNLWGMHRKIRVKGAASTLKNIFLLSYNEPYLLGNYVSLSGVLLRDSRTEKNIDTDEVLYKSTRYATEAIFEKVINDNLKAQLSYNYSLVEVTDQKAGIILSDQDRGTLAISSIRPGLLFDTRDNPFNPSAGFLLGASLKLASTYLIGETDFLKLNLNGSGYMKLMKRVIFAAAVKGGLAQGFNDTEELPIVERYFLGGRTTVRGFNHDTLGPKGSDGTPTGGNAYLMSNLELRTDIGRNFGLVTFLDTGNVWSKLDTIDLTLRYTAGVGLRYTTPVGPLSLDYGYKLDRKDDESAGEFHFSLGHPF